MSGFGRILSEGVVGPASTVRAVTLTGIPDTQAQAWSGAGRTTATSNDNPGTNSNTVTAPIASGGERHCPNPELHWKIHVADAY